MGSGTNNGYTFWPSKTWFLERMSIATEPQGSLHTSERLLWNVISGKAIPKVMRDIPSDCFEALIIICARNGIAKKIIDSWTKVTRENYQKCMNADVLPTIIKGYPHLRFV